MAREFYLVSYDIADDKRRLKVAHLLEGYGERVQYSVFELWAGDEAMAKLRERLAALVEEEGSVRVYHLCALCRDRRAVVGEGAPTAPPDLQIV
jgi:CRISPR-associated protein Cas2